MSNHARGLWGYTGRPPAGDELTIQSTGMGGPSAAVVLADLAELGVRRAVRVGTCAALGELAPGELLVVGEARGAARRRASAEATDAAARPGAYRGAGRRTPSRRRRSPASTASARRSATRRPSLAEPPTCRPRRCSPRARELGVAVAALLDRQRDGDGGQLARRGPRGGGETRRASRRGRTLTLKLRVRLWLFWRLFRPFSRRMRARVRG